METNKIKNIIENKYNTIENWKKSYYGNSLNKHVL